MFIDAVNDAVTPKLYWYRNDELILEVTSLTLTKATFTSFTILNEDVYPLILPVVVTGDWFCAFQFTNGLFIFPLLIILLAVIF